MKPPISGPKASAMAPIAVQIPIAAVRSRASRKVAMMIASVVGTRKAALDGRDRDIRHVVVEVRHECGESNRHEGPPASGHRLAPLNDCTTQLYVVPIRDSYTLYASSSWLYGV